MARSRTQLILLALTHAGLSAGLLGILREARHVPPPEILDAVMCGMTAIAILFFWWHRRNAEPDPIDGVIVGFKAAVAVGAMLFAPVLLGVLSGHVNWLLAIVLIDLFGLVVGILVTAILGGMLASAGFEAVRRIGRAGTALGIAFALAGLALPIAAGTIEIAAGMGLSDYMTRNDAHHLFPVTVSTRLTVGDTPIALDRVISCQRLLSRDDIAQGPGSPDPRLNYHWLPNLKSFGQAFADGSGVFVITPDICRHFAPSDEGSGLTVEPEGYVPLIGWTKDAAALDSFELYTDGTAFARPDARVRFVSIAMHKAPPGTPQSAFDAFARIGWGSARDGAYYRAIYGIALDRALWRLEPKIATRLDQVKSPSFVLSDVKPVYTRTYLPPPLGWFFSPPTGVYLARNGEGISATPRFYGAREKRPVTVFPLRRDDRQEWTAATDDQGVMAFYRADPARRPGPQPSVMPTAISLDGKRLAGDPSLFIYLPASGALVRLVAIDLWLAPPSGPYASRP
jgi:hypothetical protein